MYVHFDDLDDLFRAAADRHLEQMAELLAPVAANLALAERVGASLEQRAALHERFGPVRRAAEQWAPHSPALAEVLRQARAAGRRDIDRLFGPELRGRTDHDVALSAINALMSAAAWDSAAGTGALGRCRPRSGHARRPPTAGGSRWKSCAHPTIGSPTSPGSRSRRTTSRSPRGDGSGSLRVHYLDVGPADATETVLLMHGEPSWSYLYRHMIPVITAAGHRCVAPDLVGFGRSDKPAARTDYTYQRHVDWMTEWLTTLDLTDITLVCQDWGGLIGLRLVAAMPERFRRVVAANTFLPTGDRNPGDAFLAWREFSQAVRDVPGRQHRRRWLPDRPERRRDRRIRRSVPGRVLQGGGPAVPAARPDHPGRPGVRAEPRRVGGAGPVRQAVPVPRSPTRTPSPKGGDAAFLKSIPGARGQAHTTIAGGGHFLQEDRGPELAAVVNAFIAATPA